ncbi:MAG TPA: homoserine O-acetyltransferase, partial [Candidatus Hydrogenedens sp.]|nr:homoserine O-acetyltransferase [Candidatus Hydrogenedens sp.]
METTSVGIVETKYYTFAQAPEYLILESGAKLGPVSIAYETYGELSPDKDNAILVCHALSGDAHAAGFHSPDDKKPGWWDPMIGPGKALDTNRYFVVCSNALGGCSGSTGPLSTNPATGQPYGTDFPFVTIGDMVRAQQELMKYLGIPQWLCVIGGSMGGMQALEWGVHYPDKTKSIVVISAPAVSDAQQIAFHAVGRHAILSDSQFDNGRYYPSSGPTNGLAVARMLAHITYLSDDSMKGKFGRKLQNGNQYRYDVNKEFSIESYLDYQGEKFVNRFDANSYLYITKAIDYFDISRGYKNLDEAMGQVRGKTLVISFSSDWLYPPEKSR